MKNPFDSSDTKKRSGSFAKLLIAAILAMGIVQFSVVERIVGRYLAVHNAERPLIGQAWQSGVEKEMAAGRSEVSELTTGVRGELSQWLMRAQRGRPTTLSLTRFATLWDGLPTYLSESIIPDEEWQKLAMNLEVDRVRPSTSRRGIELTFLTSTNRILKRFAINNDMTTRLTMHGQMVNDSLAKASTNIKPLPGKQLTTQFQKLSAADQKLLWSIFGEDILSRRPISRYAITALDETYSLLWVEYTNPNMTSISYLIPNPIAAAFLEDRG
ncbi:MAG: hypothetical protein OEM52_07065 [bacterium]|nr:hypothetical protein [bacterium]